MRLVLVVVFLSIGGLSSMSEQDRSGFENDDADSVHGLLEDEAALTVMMLHTENTELKDRVARQDSEIEGLQRKLAETMARLDVEKVESGKPVADVTVPRAKISLDDLTQLRVLDVNPMMKVVVLSGGMRAGMKVGMVFSIVRDDESIAEIRLVDVRERIAGGLIEKMMKGLFPEAGDRLVLREAQN